MKKNLLAMALISGVFLSWACQNSASHNPNAPISRQNPTPTPTVYPTVAPTFSPTPGFIAGWAVSGPNGLAAGNGYLYVAEADGSSVSQVQLFNSSNASVTQWTRYGSTPFLWPSGVAVNGAGNVYVLDAGDPNNQGVTGAAVYEFSNAVSAVGVTSWKTYGTTTLNDPSGIALDSSGNVYVADMGNFEVEEFGSGGATIGEWNNNNDPNFWPSAVASAGSTLYVVDAGNFVIWKLPTISGTATSFPIVPASGQNPFYGLAVDSTTGNLLLADYDNSLVEVYSSTGTLISEMNGNFGAATPFVGPDAILLNGGNIYVGDYDSGTGNIQIFGPNNY